MVYMEDVHSTLQLRLILKLVHKRKRAHNVAYECKMLHTASKQPAARQAMANILQRMNSTAKSVSREGPALLASHDFMISYPPALYYPPPKIHPLSVYRIKANFGVVG